MEIRRFRNEDAAQVSQLVCRNFIEINSKDYPLSHMQALAKSYDAEKVLDIAAGSHTYVVLDAGKIIGTGSIAGFWGSETESILLTIFVLPEYHGQGVGRKIIETLEQDELFSRASRIEIPASITACGFYERMGYSYKNGVKKPDEEGHVRMEKYR